MTQPRNLTERELSHEVTSGAAENDSAMSWLDDAACGSLPLDQIEIFFVKAGRTIGETALALCRGCAVRLQCLEHAQQHDILNGYFGGVSPSARRAHSSSDGTTQGGGVQRSATSPKVWVN